ncbi:ribonuclease H-like domain-containing protein [Tanacetum coccineum]
MELENTQNNALAKLPMLKLGEYEMWEIRIKQYFQIQDYALWEVIENGNSWVPIPVTTPPESGTSTTTKMTVPATIEEKTCKKNDVKARSLLLMALPNEHQLTFDQYVDAQSMFAAIKARFGGNEATKKTDKQQRRHRSPDETNTLKKQYDDLLVKLDDTVFKAATYKRGRQRISEWVLKNSKKPENKHNWTVLKLALVKSALREKGIKREYSVARTPQQNGVAERKNRTLIEAARTMLADSKLPTTFWAEAVSTACYVHFLNDFAGYTRRSVADTQIQDKDRLQDENDATEKSNEDCSSKNQKESLKLLVILLGVEGNAEDSRYSSNCNKGLGF